MNYYLKWIVCKVFEDSKQNFDRAQQKWTSLSDCRGFIAQWGGWDIRHHSDACIVSLWNKKDDYENFMNEHHDLIISDNNQLQTYQEIHTSFFSLLMYIKKDQQNWFNLVHQSEIMRVADCIVKPRYKSHFESMQETVWNPVMNQSKGMLGGGFHQSLKNPHHYLVTTLWRNQDFHQAYTTEQVGHLRKQSKMSRDIQTITGRCIRLKPEWFVS